MIGNKVRQIAEEVCQGKGIAFDGSGYDPRSVLLPRGWLASICGLTGIEIDIEEPYPSPPGHRTDFAIAEVKRTVQAVNITFRYDRAISNSVTPAKHETESMLACQ